MIGDLGNHRHFRAGTRDDVGVDAFHVGGNQIDQGIDRWITCASEGYDDGQSVISPIGRDGQTRFPTEAMRRCWRSAADKSSKKWRLLATFARVSITYLLASIKIQTGCRHQTPWR